MVQASSLQVSGRMRRQARRDTSVELQLRHRLHGMGLRYRVHLRPLEGVRRQADIVFRHVQVAVFVDGCFWHGCPDHGTWPKANAEWWRHKIVANQSRDRDTDERLRGAGWESIRVWEHEPPDSAAERVAKAVGARRLARLPGSVTGRP